jgi:uncharacterized protein with PIN domain
VDDGRSQVPQTISNIGQRDPFLKRGGHPAQLNYGDCFAAAAATIYEMPLLYAGKDFQAAGF